MLSSIPVVIIVQNTDELTQYKNRTFLPFIKSFLENYGIIRNAVIFCADDESEEYCKELGFGNIHRVQMKQLNDKTTFNAVNNYFMNVDTQSDWCILLKPYKIIKDPTILYKAIQSINDHFDIMLFSTHIYDFSPLTIQDDTVKSDINLGKINNAKQIIEIIDDSLFICKTSFLNNCYKLAKGDVEKYSKLLVSTGKIKILKSADEVTMSFTSIEQINNFMHFLSFVKYNANVI